MSTGIMTQPVKVGRKTCKPDMTPRSLTLNAIGEPLMTPVSTTTRNIDKFRTTRVTLRPWRNR